MHWLYWSLYRHNYLLACLSVFQLYISVWFYCLELSLFLATLLQLAAIIEELQTFLLTTLPSETAAAMDKTVNT